MYQHLLHFINLFLLHNSTNLIQLSFFLIKILVLEIFTRLYNIFFINPIIKRNIVAFPVNIYFIAFSLYHFFNSEHFLISFLQFFFVKTSNNFFALKITYNICPRNNAINFLIRKNSSDQFGT